MRQSIAPSPWYSFMLLLVLTLVCTFLSQFLFVISYWLLNGGLQQGLSGIKDLLQTDSKTFLYGSLLTGSIGTFLLPSLWLQKLEEPHVQYFKVQKKQIGLYALVLFFFLLVSNPFMELIGLWNQQLSLPEAFQDLESWMYEKEQAMALVIEKMVMVGDIKFLLLNILVMAAVPAIVEEFYFRGSIQTIFNSLFKNPHLSIWFTAIVFSAIHLQFYGFLPRMFLGVIFGYSLYWSGNIWLAVFGHFVNNFSVTLIAFYYFKNGKSFSELQQSAPYSFWIYGMSAILMIGLGYYFYTIRQKKLTYE